MGMSMNGWMSPLPTLHRDNYLFPRLTPSVEVTQVVQTALPKHYQGYRCELTAQTSFTAVRERERSRGWEGWTERKEELGRNAKEEGRLGWMERRTAGWVDG